MTQRRWSVGALARASGLTVRTLHHYDEIGLVAASERTASGHRRYTEPDVRRLYQVRALRQLGLPLEEIAAVLDRPAQDLGRWRRVLTAQLADLDARAARISELRRRVQGLLRHLETDTMPEPQQFLAALELTVPIVDASPYLSARQRGRLERRAAELGGETVEVLKQRWLGLVERLRQHVRDRTPVDDPRVQALAEQWRQIGGAFRTGDQEVDGAAEAIWRDHGATIDERLSERIDWLNPGELTEVIDYLRQVR